jgi:hypothetical protein
MPEANRKFYIGFALDNVTVSNPHISMIGHRHGFTTDVACVLFSEYHLGICVTIVIHISREKLLLRFAMYLAVTSLLMKITSQSRRGNNSLLFRLPFHMSRHFKAGLARQLEQMARVNFHHVPTQVHTY